VVHAYDPSNWGGGGWRLEIGLSKSPGESLSEKNKNKKGKAKKTRGVVQVLGDRRLAWQMQGL
jgi:hypothetical protein